MKRRVSGIAVAILLAIGAPAAAVPVDVRVEGVDGQALDNVEALLPFSGYDEDDLTDLQVQRLHEQAPDAIRRALEPFGWYRPAIVPLLERQGSGWVATYRITPGPRVRVTAIDFALSGPGANDPELTSSVRRFPLREGDPLLHASYELGKRDLIDRAGRRGYLDARFTAEDVLVEPHEARARIVLHYETGPRYHFGPVRFEQDILREELLQGMVEFERGEPLDYRKLLELQNNLRQSSYFSFAEVTPLRSEAVGTEVPILVHVTPSKPRRYEAGAGYGTDTGPQVEGAVDFRRLNRRGHHARVETDVSRIRKDAAVHYYIPRGRLRAGLFAISAGFHDEDTDAQDSRAWLGNLRLTSPRGPWQESYGLEYRWELFETGPDSGHTQLLMPFTEYVRTLADDVIDTRRGFRLRLLARGAADAVVSDVSFAQFNPRGRAIIPSGRRGRVITRAELGWTAVNDFSRLPPSMRFFAGGATSVRGYGYQDLGVVDPTTGTVRGGKHLLVGSVEYEYRFRRRWGVAAFYDIGNAFDHFRDGFKSGAGVGLRWISPVGPVRLDAAWGLSDDRPPARLHLRIGPDL